MATPMASPETAQEAIGTTFFEYTMAEPCAKLKVLELASQLLPPLYTLVFGVGLMGNVIVVVILTKYRRLCVLTNIYLLNLAISDLLFLVTLPFWIHYTKERKWVFGYGMCKLVSGFYNMGLYGETFFIILLTLDRYLAVVHAVFALRTRTATFGVITSVLTWILVGLAALPEMIFHKAEDELGYSSCSSFYPENEEDTWKRFHIVKMNILSLALPLLIMAVCYWGIIKTLGKCPSKKKSKAIRLIFIIVVVFFISWAPYNLVLLLHTFQMVFFQASCERSNQLDVALLVTEVIAFTHCCINPVIYAFAGERFREHLHHCFRRHVAVCPGRCIRLLAREKSERGSSVSPSTAEQELSVIF